MWNFVTPTKKVEASAFVGKTNRFYLRHTENQHNICVNTLNTSSLPVFARLTRGHVILPKVDADTRFPDSRKQTFKGHWSNEMSWSRIIYELMNMSLEDNLPYLDVDSGKARKRFLE